MIARHKGGADVARRGGLAEAIFLAVFVAENAHRRHAGRVEAPRIPVGIRARRAGAARELRHAGDRRFEVHGAAHPRAAVRREC